MVNKKPLTGGRAREIPIAPPRLDSRGEELFELLERILPPDFQSEVTVCVDLVTIRVRDCLPHGLFINILQSGP